MEWGYTLSGFAVGILVGLTGIGGGSLMTLLLIFVYGVAPITAVGTDLLFAAITKACGIVIHHRKSTVEWKIVRLMLAGKYSHRIACDGHISALEGPRAVHKLPGNIRPWHCFSAHVLGHRVQKHDASLGGFCRATQQ